MRPERRTVIIRCLYWVVMHSTCLQRGRVQAHLLDKTKHRKEGKGTEKYSCCLGRQPQEAEYILAKDDDDILIESSPPSGQELCAENYMEVVLQL